MKGPGVQPRYRAVKEYISDKIRSGDYPAGARIPTEKQLTEMFAVSRMTVNRALRELVAEGLLLRRQGVGTFVSSVRGESPLLEIRNIADEIRDRHHVYSNRLECLELTRADERIAARLGVAVGVEVWHSLLVHLENGIPVQLEDRYVRRDIVADYGAQDFSRQTPNQYLSTLFPLSELEHIVEAILPDERVRRLLDMDRYDPCLLVTRRTWSGQQLVSCASLYHPGSRYRLCSRIGTTD